MKREGRREKGEEGREKIEKRGGRRGKREESREKHAKEKAGAPRA